MLSIARQDQILAGFQKIGVNLTEAFCGMGLDDIANEVESLGLRLRMRLDPAELMLMGFVLQRAVTANG